MPSLHYSLPFAGLVLLVLFLAWHYRHLYVDRLPPALSSRIRHYTPLRTFEDAAEQGTLCRLDRPVGWEHIVRQADIVALVDRLLHHDLRSQQ